MATTEVRPSVTDQDTGPIPVMPKRRLWRDRIVPKTVLGMTMIILAGAIGASLSGVVLYSYYEYRLNRTETKVADFINGFQATRQQAIDAINAKKDDAKAEVDKELEPIKKIQAEGQTLDALVKKAGSSLFFVHTVDEAGQPSVGTAFAVAADQQQTFLITSFTAVRAATRRPGPDVFVRQGTGQDVKVTVWTWQEERDLALIILPKGSTPKLDFASGNPPTAVGDRIFAVSALGSDGGSASQGFVGDVSAAGIQHDAAIGPSFQGGPIMNSDGKVVAISSRTYAPLGFGTDGVWFGVPVNAVCEKVLKCPNGSPTGAGQQR